jgi:hypothetical protein
LEQLSNETYKNHGVLDITKINGKSLHDAAQNESISRVVCPLVSNIFFFTESTSNWPGCDKMSSFDKGRALNCD